MSERPPGMPSADVTKEQTPMEKPPIPPTLEKPVPETASITEQADAKLTPEMRAAIKAAEQVPVGDIFPPEIANVLGIDGAWEVHKRRLAKRREAQPTRDEYVESNIKKHEAPSQKIDCEPIIQEFLALVNAFEATYPLADLHAITDLTVEDAPNHPVRSPAKEAHEPITVLLNKLIHSSNISSERCAEMRAIDKRLSQAIGIISRGKVDHTR